MPLVPMFFANGIFFCRWSRVWEVLVNDVTPHYRNGGENQDISSLNWESDFRSNYDDWVAIYDENVVVV